MNRRTVSAVSLASTFVSLAHAQQPSEEPAARFKRMSREAEEKGLAEPFKGITTDGKVVPGLFPIRSTGVSTEPVQKVAAAFLEGLTEEQRKATMFPVE